MSWPLVDFAGVAADVSSGNAKTLQSDFLPRGRYPIIDQGQSFIAGYTNDASRLCNVEAPVIVFGDHTKCLKFVDFPFCMGADGTKILSPREGVDPKYLYYALQTVHIPEVGYSRHFKYLKEAKLPLPPIRQQRRIATILDQADALRRKRQLVIAHLGKFGQAVFREMFGDVVANERNFPRGTVADLVQGFDTGKNLAPSTNEKTNNRVLKVSAVTSGSFDQSESKPLPDHYRPPAGHFVKRGDLLFSRANTVALIGATALVHDVGDNIVLPDKVWRFVWREGNEAIFTHHLFQSPAIRREISRRASGTSGSMKNIGKEKVLSIAMGIPGANSRREFERRMQGCTSMLANAASALQATDALFASLQHRAFNGDL